MASMIVNKTLAAVWRLLVLYSVYILLRGHNEPGGGFIGGLLLALAIILRGYVYPGDRLGAKLAKGLQAALGFLMVVLMLTIVSPVLLGDEVLTGLWTKIWVPIAGKFSSVLVFDIAVYLVVAASSVYAYGVLKQADEGGESC